MTLLYPQLPPRRARELVEELAKASCRKLEDGDIDHRWTIRSATGGTSASPEHLGMLRKAIRQVGTEHGYIYGAEGGPPPLQGARRGSFDAALARCLATHLEVSASEASRPGLWCFLGCVVAPELIRWRFWSEKGTTHERFLGNRLRNMYGRVWWRARLLRDEQGEDPWWLLDELGEDEMVQITERPNAAGYRPLTVALGRSLVESWQDGMPINRTNLLRDVMKRILRLLPLTAMEMLDDEQVDAEIASLFRESLRSQGVGLDEKTEEVVVVRYDEALPWREVSRERRYALVEVLTDEQLARLEPLLDRRLPEHKEYQLRWRVHHQLSATIGQVVGLLGRDLPERLGPGELGPWLAEQGVGSWARDTDPGRAAQLIDTLLRPDLERLFATFGWSWSEKVTWSDAQQQLRRRYNGGWDELLLLLQRPALLEIANRFGLDATLPTRELLQSIARWLTVNPTLPWAPPEALPQEPAPTAPVPQEVPANPRAADSPSIALSSPMPAPPSLIQVTLNRAGVRTVGELLELDTELLRSMPGVGPRKLEMITNFQAEVAAGLMASQDFASETTESSMVPSFNSLEELDRWLFEVLEGRAATVFALRFDGATLTEIGEALGLSRERARQLVNSAIAELHRQVGARAGALLRERTGVHHLGPAILIEDTALHLAAIASVATGETWTQVQPGFAWRGPRGSLGTLTQQLHEQIGERETLTPGDLEGLASTVQQPVDLVRNLLLRLEGWLADGEGLRQPTDHRSGARQHVVQRLRDHSGPAHQNEMASWLMELEGVEEWPAEDRTFIRRVESMMDRDPDVLRYDRGTFIHVDHLPAPREQLEKLVDRCVEWVVAVDGPVAVADLLGRLAETGADASALNTYLLKSLLLLRPEVKALRKGLVMRAQSGLAGEIPRLDASLTHGVDVRGADPV
jgi:hypothetical protein